MSESSSAVFLSSLVRISLFMYRNDRHFSFVERVITILFYFFPDANDCRPHPWWVVFYCLSSPLWSEPPEAPNICMLCVKESVWASGFMISVQLFQRAIKVSEWSSVSTHWMMSVCGGTWSCLSSFWVLLTFSGLSLIRSPYTFLPNPSPAFSALCSDLFGSLLQFDLSYYTLCI